MNNQTNRQTNKHKLIKSLAPLCKLITLIDLATKAGQATVALQNCGFHQDFCGSPSSLNIDILFFATVSASNFSSMKGTVFSTSSLKIESTSPCPFLKKQYLKFAYPIRILLKCLQFIAYLSMKRNKLQDAAICTSIDLVFTKL